MMIKEGNTRVDGCGNGKMVLTKSTGRGGYGTTLF